MEPLELAPRFQAEFLGDQGAPGLVDREGVGHPAAAVEGQHQLAAQPFPQRLLPDERLELADEFAVAAQGELRLDALHDDADPALLQRRRLGPDQLLRTVGQWLPPPLGEAGAVRLHRVELAVLPERGSRVRDGLVERQQVEPVPTELEAVAVARPDDQLRPELTAQLGHALLDLGHSGRRRRFPPQDRDESFHRDDVFAAEQQRGQHRSRLAPVEPDCESVAPCRDRPKNTELECHAAPS